MKGANEEDDVLVGTVAWYVDPNGSRDAFASLTCLCQIVSHGTDLFSSLLGDEGAQIPTFQEFIQEYRTSMIGLSKHLVSIRQSCLLNLSVLPNRLPQPHRFLLPTPLRSFQPCQSPKLALPRRLTSSVGIRKSCIP